MYYTVLYSHIRASLLSGFLRSSFPPEIVYAFIIIHAYYMPLPSHLPLFDHSNNI